MITIKDLSKKYGSKTVLNGIDLSFDAGKVYGVVGKNGAGKTTLFNCIAGIERYEGDIDSKFETLKNHLGILETNPIFLSHITGWEYLKLHCIARGIAEEDFEGQNIFDLPLHEYAVTYSTGMKKKLALMAILLQKNDVYILDEPFNGVDIQSNILITAIIEELKRKGKTVIISSHIFSTLSDTCDQIFLMKDGVIAKSATQTEFEVLKNEMKDDVIGGNISMLVL